MLSKDLQQIGFSKNTSHVYLALSEFGEAKAGQIVQKTGLHRNLVYRALEELEQKKMITRTEKRGVAWFKMLDPVHLLNELKEKQAVAEHLIETLRTSYKTNPQEVVVREGKDEIRRYYLETAARLKKGDCWFLLGLEVDWFFEDPTFNKKYIELYKKNQFTVRAITGKITERELKAEQEFGVLNDIRIIPDITFESFEIGILPDRIAITILIEPYTIIEIFNKKFVASYIAHFNALWHQEVKTYRGWTEVEQLFFRELLPARPLGDTSYCIGGGYGLDGNDKHVADFYIRYTTARIQAGGYAKILFYEQHRKKAQHEFTESGDPTLAHTELHFLPETYYSPLQIQLIAGKTIIQTWGKEPVSTVYEGKEVFDSFKKQFDLLWTVAKE